MNTVYTATDAMVAEQQAITNLSSDLANADTPGFLALMTTNVGDPVGALVRVGGPDAAPIPLGPPEPEGVAAVTRISTADGSPTPTQNPDDVAVSAGGFLTVRTPQGVAYTRNGTLQVSAAGQLTTAQGDPVLNPAGHPIRLTPDNPWAISPTGVVTQTGRAPQTLAIHTLTGPITDAGHGLYQGTAGPWAGQVLTGALTASNVSLDTTMTQLVAAQARYAANADVFNEEGTRLTQTADLAQMPAAGA